MDRLTAAEQQALDAAARRAAASESQPWRVGDQLGGVRRKNRRRPRRDDRRSGVLLGLLLLAAVAVVVYAAFFGTATPGGTKLHLPNLTHVFEVPGYCSPGAYPRGAQYSFERCVSARTPLGWPRCSRVTYRLDAARAPQGSGGDVTAAISALEGATGLLLVPVTGSAEISISWDPALYDPTPGRAGEAGSTDFKTTSGLSGARVTSATILISAHLSAGGQSGIGEEPVLLHELGHAVGLGHYLGPVVMNPLDRGFTSYQPGDLAGFNALYHPSTCRSS